jgi:hypothetical protein
MNISLEILDKSLLNKLKEIERELPDQVDKALFDAAAYGASLILDRTEKGDGVDGAFAPYSKQYAAAKKAGWPRTKTRSAFSGDATGIVNLMVTGKMLSAITPRKGRGYSEIRFSTATANKKAFFNNQKRPFFKFNMTEQRLIVARIKKRLFG